jgi:hypothetical protein
MFCWHKYKTGNIEKYKIKGELMQMRPEVKDLLLNHNEQFIKNSNGVGSRVGFWNKLIYHIIPDSIGILNITGCSDLHDNGFEEPRAFKTLKEAYKYFEDVNIDFLSNLRRRIEDGTHLRWIRKSRYFIATRYFNAVQSFIGWTSFMDGKLINGKKIPADVVKMFYEEVNNQKKEE